MDQTSDPVTSGENFVAAAALKDQFIHKIPELVSQLESYLSHARNRTAILRQSSRTELVKNMNRWASAAKHSVDNIKLGE